MEKEIKKDVTPKTKKTKQEKPKERNVSAIKLKVLITIINRRKTDYFMDLIQSFDCNMQSVVRAEGTVDSNIMSILGLTSKDKSVIFSIINEAKEEELLSTLEDKFNTIRDGKGVAVTIPLSSVIGVQIYKFLSNTRV